jgi:hypothetical protein
MAANTQEQPTARRRGRGPGRPFTPGRSGNPAGRPKVVGEVRDLARAHTETALNTLVSIASNPRYPPAARVSAASALLDRGYGRPAQELGITPHPPAPLGGPLTVTDASEAARVYQLMMREEIPLDAVSFAALPAPVPVTDQAPAETGK